MKDYKETHYTPMQRICEAIRIDAQITHNSAFGRKRKDMIDEPKRLVQFPWEEPMIKSAEEIKKRLLGLSMAMDGISVKQKGEPVDVKEA